MDHTANEMKIRCHTGEGRGVGPAGPARRREPPARPRPRGQHEHAPRDPPDHRGTDGRGGNSDLPLQFPLHGARQGSRLPGGLHGDRPLGGRGGARGRPRPRAPGRRPLLRRPHDLHGGLGVAPRRRARPGLLRVPPPPARQARHEARGAPRRGHCPDALPQRHPRRRWRTCDLLQPVCKKLGKRATLHLLDTADHGFHTLKRSRKSARMSLSRWPAWSRGGWRS